MDSEQLSRVEKKLDQLLELLQPISKILVRSKEVVKALGLNKDTLSQNRKVSKYEEVGHRRTYVEIGEVSVVKKRKVKHPLRGHAQTYQIILWPYQ